MASTKLPGDLCFVDRCAGQVAIMPVMRNRAEQWIDNLYTGPAFRPVITLKQRRAAALSSKQRVRDQLGDARGQPRCRKKRKRADHKASVQDAIYWAPVDADTVDTTEAFIEAMAIEEAQRTRDQERAIDTYWTQGMSLDPVLKTETISETKAYLTKVCYEDWRRKDYMDRGVEVGDLDQIDTQSEALTARATVYQKGAGSISTLKTTTRTS